MGCLLIFYLMDSVEYCYVWEFVDGLDYFVFVMFNVMFFEMIIYIVYVIILKGELIVEEEVMVIIKLVFDINVILVKFVLCFGQIIIFEVVFIVGYLYEWLIGEEIVLIEVNSLGDYIVIVINSNQC